MSLRTPVEIGLVIYPGSQLASVYGLTDAFEVAQRLAQARLETSQPLLRVSHFSFDVARREMVRTFASHAGTDGEGASHPPDIIIAPPCLASPPSRETMGPIAKWLRERHAAGAVIGSVCAGSFLLAEAGLLDGRPATTHWAHANLFAKSYPAVKLDIGKLIVDDGDIITAGGVMAWTDLSLKLIGRILGAAAMIETARYLLIDPPGREQRNYSSFSPELSHGDAAILKVQRWLPSAETRKLSVGMMAEQAGLAERTFIRRFERATGHRPTEYRQHIRMDRAREILEATDRAIDQVAWEVGYDDVSAFRKTFLKTTGLSPAVYRKKFRIIPLVEPIRAGAIGA